MKYIRKSERGNEKEESHKCQGRGRGYVSKARLCGSLRSRLLCEMWSRFAGRAHRVWSVFVCVGCVEKAIDCNKERERERGMGRREVELVLPLHLFHRQYLSLSRPNFHIL